MKNKFVLFLVVAIAVCGLGSHTMAAVVTSFSGPNNFMLGDGSGAGAIDIFIESDSGTPTLGAYGYDFTVLDSTGTTPVSDGISFGFVSVGAYGTGVGVTSFGAPGYFANGNVDAGSYFQITDAGPGGNTNVQMSLVTGALGQAVPTSPQLLATLLVNTNLAAGTYVLRATEIFVQDIGGLDINDPLLGTTAETTFTVTAVPEPTSMMLLATTLAMPVIRRFSKKRASVAA